MSAVRVRRIYAGEEDTAAVWCMSASGLGDCGDNFSGHPYSSESVVSSDVVGDDSEEWRQRVGTATSAGTAKV